MSEKRESSHYGLYFNTCGHGIIVIFHIIVKTYLANPMKSSWFVLM